MTPRQPQGNDPAPSVPTPGTSSGTAATGDTTVAGRRRRARRVALGTAVVLLLAAGTAGALGIGRDRLPGLAGGPPTTRPGGEAGAVAAGGARRLLPTTRPPAPGRAADVPKRPTTTAPPSTSAPTTTRAARPAGGFPGPGNTGVPAGVTLRPSGPLTVSRDGAVIDRLDIDGCLTIAADDVTVRRSRIRCGGYYPVRIADGAKRALLTDVEIDGLGSPESIAIGVDNYTLRRAHVHDVGDGPRMGDNTVVEDSWIHDLAVGNGSHNDGIQSTGGSNIRILGNRIEHPGEQTSCILIGADLDDISDVLVQGNLLNGGNYTVYAGAANGHRAERVRIVGNRFGRDAVYGTHSIQANITFSGNVWHDTGAPIRR